MPGKWERKKEGSRSGEKQKGHEGCEELDVQCAYMLGEGGSYKATE